MPLTLSERALAISPSVTLSVDARAKQLRAEGVDVIGFSAGEPDFNTPEYINDAGKFAIDAGITRYTPVAGTLDLREKICEKFRHDNGVDYTPAEIIVSNGAKQSLFIALCAMLNPGDEVLLPSPCWVSYPEMIRMAGGTPVMIHGCEENNFVVTADMMRPYVTERTKALILNSPNNPNGCVWSRQELADIAALAVEVWVRGRIRAHAGAPDYLKLYVDTEEGQAVLAGTFYQQAEAKAPEPSEASGAGEEPASPEPLETGADASEEAATAGGPAGDTPEENEEPETTDGEDDEDAGKAD